MQTVQRNQAVFSDLTVYGFKEYFVIEPNLLGSYRVKPDSLMIDKTTQQVSVTSVLPNTNETPRTIQIYGIIGVITLLAGPYLVVITDRHLVGTVCGHSVFSVAAVKLLPFANVSSISQLSDRAKKYEITYKSIVDSLLTDGNFYFSYSIDLTTSLKKFYSKYPTGEASSVQSISSLATGEYFWNYEMLSFFREFDICWDLWFLPLMRGYIHICLYMAGGNPFDFMLVSRRSRYRAGTRYLTRGVDHDGRVANYVETEQFLGLNLSWTSFIQTRGSIPVFWSQTTNLKYNPKAQITHSVEETELAFRNHFTQELRRHSRQLIVNLLDEKGQEQLLTKLYCYYLRYVYESNKQIDYVGFDFHAQCRNDQYDRVNDLLKSVEDRIHAMGFTHVDNGSLESVQYGAIRTNCLDCLDRTNLVQSTFARFSLTNQLAEFGVKESDKDGILEREFKEAWANNGDAISRQYAGTGALKSDFTRTGVRNTKGKLKDGVNAISRYVINNFHDRLRQIAIDLTLGNLQVESIDMHQMEEEEKSSKKSNSSQQEIEEEIEIDFSDWGVLD